MAESVDVAVVGGGQAGLATSYELSRAGVDHVVLERGKVGQSWRGRWDSFCLVTPNWSIALPGGGYDGDDPDGYLPRDRIVDHLEAYAAAFTAPVREETDVTSLEPAEEGFTLRTQNGDLRARAVVVASGAYQRAHRPSGAGAFPPDVPQLTAEEYRNPATVASGTVLVIGSGQTGCQISEELLAAGREVILSCGRAPWVPRRIDGRDIVWWVVETGFIDQSVDTLPDASARLTANLLSTGRDGGHDLHLRTLRAAGVTLVGHFLGVEGRRVRFAADLAESVAWGDERNAQLMDAVRKLAARRGMAQPTIPVPEPFDDGAPEEIDLAGIGAVVLAGGFRPEYGRWVHVPGAFDDLGFPIHTEGASRAAPGLFFVGVHFLRKRKSSLLFGVGEDAAIVARQLVAARRA